MWTTCAWRRWPRRSRAASSRSYSIPGRSRLCSSVRHGRWNLLAEASRPAGTAELIDGTALADRVCRETAARVTVLKARGVTPGLTVILVGDDAASTVYVGSKEKTCLDLGMNGETIHMLVSATEQELLW